MTRHNRFMFDEAITEFCKNKGRIIVEIGGIRSRGARAGDGHSTLRWPTDAEVWSVDNDPAAVNLTRQLTADRPNVLCVLADALSFLRMFPARIDLLYLDGPSPDHGSGRDWHLEAYRLASFSDRAVLLIDDTDLPQLGKGQFVIPTAVEDGFNIVATDRQSLLVRDQS